MIGYWVASNPVKTSDAAVPATIYQQDKKVMVALASWAPNEVKIKLHIDWKALNIDASKAVIEAPAINNFQPAQTFAPGDEIPVSPAKGWMLIIHEQ